MYVYTYIYIRIKTDTFKVLLVSCFHIHQAYAITLTRYTSYIITTKFKLQFHFSISMPIVVINIAIKQYGTTLNIII